MVNMQPIYLSMEVAAISLIFVTALGTAMALLMRRYSFRGKSVVEAALTMPLVLPPVVTGYILLLLIGKQGPVGYFLLEYFDTQIIFTPAAAVLAAAIVSFPMMYQTAKAAFQTIDPNLEDIARTLGASEGRILTTITLPLAWPGLVAGAVLSFSRALGEFGATIMVAGSIAGKTQTIPLAIYFAADANDFYTAGVYVFVIGVITFTAIFWANQWLIAKNQPVPRKGRCLC